jgi:hypothetical protein
MNAETLSMIYGIVLAGSAATGLTGLILLHREKVGLLKLVQDEVTNNLDYLKKLGLTDDRALDYLLAPGLKSRAWDQSSNKLAELVGEGNVEFLVSCYASLSILTDRLTNPKVADDLSFEEHQAQIKSVISHHWLAFDVCQQETSNFRAWSKGMLVSKPLDERSQEPDQEEEEDTDGRPEDSVQTGSRINIHGVDNPDQAPAVPQLGSRSASPMQPDE